MVRSSAAGTRTRFSRRTVWRRSSTAGRRVRASLRTRNVRLAGVPTDDSMKPETRDQPAATPANERTQDARPRTVEYRTPRRPAGAHGPTVRQGWPIPRQLPPASGRPPGARSHDRTPPRSRAGSEPPGARRRQCRRQQPSQPPGGRAPAARWWFLGHWRRRPCAGAPPDVRRRRPGRTPHP